MTLSDNHYLGYRQKTPLEHRILVHFREKIVSLQRH